MFTYVIPKVKCAFFYILATYKKNSFIFELNLGILFKIESHESNSHAHMACEKVYIIFMSFGFASLPFFESQDVIFCCLRLSNVC